MTRLILWTVAAAGVAAIFLAAPLADGACQGYADLACCLTGCCS